MTVFAFWLIFASVFLHAFWHCLCKSQNPVPAFYLAVSGAGLTFELAIALFVGIHIFSLPKEVYFWAALGGFSGMICNAGLAYAYRLSDVSLAYPLARALPVLLTALITLVFSIGNTLSATAMSGMMVIMLGSLMIPMKTFSDFHWKNYWKKSLLFILIAAIGTTGYTVFDGIAMKLIARSCPEIPRFHGAIAYGIAREFFLSIFLWSYVLTVPFERKMISGKIFCRPHAYVAGTAASMAYILVLIAMTGVTNVSFVQAFRQMSLPVGFLIGIFILKEKCPVPKFVGVTLIILGLVLAAV